MKDVPDVVERAPIAPMTKQMARAICAEYQRTLDEYRPGYFADEREVKLWNLLSGAYASLAFRYGEIFALEAQIVALSAPPSPERASK